MPSPDVERDIEGLGDSPQSIERHVAPAQGLAERERVDAYLDSQGLDAEVLGVDGLADLYGDRFRRRLRDGQDFWRAIFARHHAPPFRPGGANRYSPAPTANSPTL